MSRYPARPITKINAEERESHEKTENLIDKYFPKDVFATENEDGALVGPFAPLLYTPAILKVYHDQAAAITATLNVSPAAKETAILGVGSVFQAKYELYAHTKLAQLTELSDKQIGLIAQGKKPEGEDELNEECGLAFDVSTELAGKPGPLSNETWSRAHKLLGTEGSLALIHLCAYYAYTCLLLNGADVPVPE